jgi:hypothetical protein
MLEKSLSVTQNDPEIDVPVAQVQVFEKVIFE